MEIGLKELIVGGAAAGVSAVGASALSTHFNLVATIAGATNPWIIPLLAGAAGFFLGIGISDSISQELPDPEPS